MADKGATRDTTEAPVAYAGTGGTVAIHGRRFATGLVWESVVEGSKPDAQARSAAAENAADLFCLRKPGRIQFGLGSRAAGHRPGMAPLAAALTEVVEGSFVAVFETSDNSYYLTAVREDQILAGNDRLIGSRTEAMDAFHELFVAMTWGQAIAPKEWLLEGTTAATLEDLLAAARPKSTLQTVSRTGTWMKLGGVAALLMVGGISYMLYSNAEAERQAAEEAAMLASRRMQEEQLRQQNARLVIPPMPWEGKPFGVPVLAKCVDSVLAAPINVPGWEAVTVGCTNDGMSIGMKRDGGTINWIGAALNQGTFRPSVTQPQPNAALVSWPLQLDIGRYTKDSRTGSVLEARRYLTLNFEEIYQPIEFREEDGTSIQVPNDHGGKSDYALERHLVFSFKTRQDPKDYVAILAPVPGLVLSMARLDLATWTWTVEGTIYERRPLPATGGAGAPAR